MQLALDEAQAAMEHDDVPVGAVIVNANGELIASARNEREALANPVAHAEVQALVKAASTLGEWNLSGSTLYVTLEPCPMCAGALVQARVREVVFAANDPKGGVLSLNIPVLDNPALNHRVKVRQGPLSEKAASLLQGFFRKKRREKGCSGKKDRKSTRLNSSHT